MNFEQFSETINIINEAIANTLSKSNSINLDILFDSMKYSALNGGKRVRPLLMMLLAKAYGLQDMQILHFAVGLELIHTYSLVHDDLPAMDDDIVRRGKPTNHVIYGEAMAILSGDGLLTMAVNHISEELVKHENIKESVDALKLLTHHAGALGMVGGQAIDVLHENKSLNKELLEEMIDLKTVALFRAACVIPGIIAMQNEEEISKLDDFAIALGRSFQIQDDILDFLEDKATGKPTYATILGVEEAANMAMEMSQKALCMLRDKPEFENVVTLTSMLIGRSY
ncbi:MAG: polyprenyl synthetase family protein [Tissierellia bacterium]|nr:polyprenyl synthetase family protein [Tissierellia bacterium]